LGGGYNAKVEEHPTPVHDLFAWDQGFWVLETEGKRARYALEELKKEQRFSWCLLVLTKNCLEEAVLWESLYAKAPKRKP
jgi:hypothetical protein